MAIWLYVTDSLCCTAETTTTLQINYTPLKKKKKEVPLSKQINYTPLKKKSSTQ